MKKKYKSIIKEIDDLFTGELNFEKLSEKAATVLSDKADLIGAGLFAPKENYLFLYSYSQNSITKFVDPIVSKQKNGLRIFLSENKNIIVKSYQNVQVYEANNLNFFSQSKSLNTVARKVHILTGAKKQLSSPIVFKGKVYGVAIFSTKSNNFTADQKELIEAYCSKLGQALMNISQHEKILSNYLEDNKNKTKNLAETQLEAIKNIHNLLATVNKKDDAYKIVASEIVSKLDVSHAVVLEWHEDEEKLRFKNINVPNSVISSIEKFIGTKLENIYYSPHEEDKAKSHYLKALEKNTILTTTSLYDAGIGVVSKSIAEKAQKILGMKVAITIPLSFNNQKLGVLGLSWKKEGVTEEELELLKTYGEHLSLAIYNVQRIEEQEKSELTESYHKRIIDTTRGLFAGEFDFEKASDTAITEFNEDMGFYGTNIYRKEGRKLRAYLYSRNDGTKFISKIINDSQYRNLLIPLEDSESIIARAGVEMNIFETQSFENFAHKIVTKPIMNLMKTALPKDLWYASFPIMHNNKLEGVLAVGKRGAKLTPAEKEATMFFCEQLGLAMANMKAHKKIVERFEKQQQLRARNIDPDKKPTIKFTLRISKEIERYLTWKIHNTDKSKADFLRNLLTEDVIKNDQQYQDFLNQ